MERLVDIRVQASPRNLRKVRRMVRTAAEASRCSPELTDKLVLVVDEACANIIRHGYNGDEKQHIRFKMWREAQHLFFELHDRAPPVDPDRIRPRDLSECRPGGLGINFIDSVMDEWQFRTPTTEPGNVLWMKRKIN